MIIFVGLSKRATVIAEYIKNHPETLYEAWESNDEKGRGKTTDEDFSLSDQTIWCHTHRMYLIGYNSIKYPWYIPKDFPRDALKKQDREKLLNFIDDYNTKLKFTFCEKWIFVIIKIFYAPLAKTVHQNFRKKKFESMRQALYMSFPP